VLQEVALTQTQQENKSQYNYFIAEQSIFQDR